MPRLIDVPACGPGRGWRSLPKAAEPASASVPIGSFTDHNHGLTSRTGSKTAGRSSPQSVQFCFPLNLANPVYRYDTAGAGAQGGGSQPPAGMIYREPNPSLWAAPTFASAYCAEEHVLVLTPDACLVQFGGNLVQRPGMTAERIPAAIASMPMMNLTRNDKQFVQGGQRQWEFRYRLVIDGPGP